MLLCIAQMDTTLGDFDATVERMVAQSSVAARQGASLTVFPSTVLTGVNPLSLLDNPDFSSDVAAALEALAGRVATPCLVPFMISFHGVCAGEVALVRDGEVTYLRMDTAFNPSVLPLSGPAPVVFHLDGIDFGVSTDLQSLEAYVTGAVSADAIIHFSFDPFFESDPATRGVYGLAEGAWVEQASAANATLVVVNPVCGSDTSVFTGGSFALAPWGDLLAAAPAFEEAFLPVTLDPLSEGSPATALPYPQIAPMDFLWDALVLGLRDVVDKNGYSGVVLPAFGDAMTSTLVTLATDALGPLRVTAVLAPVLGTEALRSAVAVADALHVRTRRLAASDLSVASVALGSAPSALQTGLVRAVVTAVARESRALSLTAQDKTALSQGLDLDGFREAEWAPFVDVYRSDLLAAAAARNARGAVIPAAAQELILPPDLPGYDLLGSTPEGRLMQYDMCVMRHVELDQSVTELAADDAFGADAQTIVQDYRAREAFRRVVPPGPVFTTPHAERMRPVTCDWLDTVHDPETDPEGFAPQADEAIAQRLEEALSNPQAIAEALGQGAPQIQNYLRDLASTGVFKPDSDELWASGLFSNN